MTSSQEMKMNEMTDIDKEFVSEIRQIIDTARSNAVRSVDFCRVQMYWNIGKRIFEKEQQGKERADYGTYLIRNLSRQIMPEYGSGFSVRQLERSRQFYRLYPIASTLRTQLNWSQYKLLIAIPDKDKREYYELEAANEGWTGRQLERQINSLLYERLLMSNDKDAVLATARRERVPESPLEIIKDPMYLEFLGLERKDAYYEKDLETAIISHLADFLLEMGKGFSFVGHPGRRPEAGKALASGYRPDADVRELLRSPRKAAGRKPHHRHPALHEQERHGCKPCLAGRQQDHLRQQVRALPAYHRTTDSRGQRGQKACSRESPTKR